MMSSNQDWNQNKQQLTKRVQDLTKEVKELILKNEELEEYGLSQSDEIRELKKENEALTFYRD